MHSLTFMRVKGLTSQAINDEFRHVSNDVRLWSFFEGVPTSTGPTNTIIVEKESAVMGKLLSGYISVAVLINTQQDCLASIPNTCRLTIDDWSSSTR